MGWRIHQMNVKATFLNHMVEKKICIEKWERFEMHGRDSHVCRLKRALYGLKQTPKVWYARSDSYLQGMDFTKSDADPNL